jgi:transposase
MSGITITMSQLKQILRLLSQSYPLKAIQRQSGVSRNTIKGYIRTLEAKGLSIENAMMLEEHQLDHLLRSPTKYEAARYEAFLSRLDYFQDELRKPHVTKQILWEEYKRDYPQGYQYSRFCHYLHLNDRSEHAVLSQEHMPGEKLFIDFSGDKISYTDVTTGEIISCEIFLATLGYSNYTAVVAVHSQKLEDVIYACTKVFEQIGGCTKAIVPDNLKAAVTKADKYEPRINDVFMDMANHYGMVVIPARPYKPRDKAKVEVSVRIIYQRVFAPLRKLIFHSLNELNVGLSEQVQLLNNRIMQQYGYSRQVMLDRDERSMLIPLPVHPYELKKQLSLTVQQNSHVYISSIKKYYSAPYHFIGQKVQVIITSSLLRIYARGNCIATHLTDTTAKYNYIAEHLPSSHQVILQHMNVPLLIERAAAIDDKVKQVIEIVLKRSRHPELAYKTCNGILSLANKTSKKILIESCEIALNFNVCNYTQITRIATGRYASRTDPGTFDNTPLPIHENIRGTSNYYK